MSEGAGAPTPAAGSILERLLGDTGDTARVLEAARALGARALKPLRAALDDAAGEPVPIEIVQVDVARMGQLLSTAGSHDALTVALIQGSTDVVALRADPQAVTICVGALFGADPDVGLGRISRDLSPVEMEVTNFVLRQLAVALNAAGQLGLRLPLPGAQTGIELRKFALRDGPAVRIDFAVGAQPNAGRLVVMIPQRVALRPREDPRTAAATDSDAQSSEWTARFGEEVMRSSVTLEATMPLGRMTLGALSSLRKGQLIELTETAPAEAKLSAKNRTLFVCEFGRLGQNYTVRIKGAADGGEGLGDGIALP